MRVGGRTVCSLASRAAGRPRSVQGRRRGARSSVPRRHCTVTPEQFGVCPVARPTRLSLATQSIFQGRSSPVTIVLFVLCTFGPSVAVVIWLQAAWPHTVLILDTGFIHRLIDLLICRLVAMMAFRCDLGGWRRRRRGGGGGAAGVPGGADHVREGGDGAAAVRAPDALQGLEGRHRGHAGREEAQARQPTELISLIGHTRIPTFLRFYFIE